MGFITSIFGFFSLHKWPGSLSSVEEECEHEQLQKCSCVRHLCASQEPCAWTGSFCSLHLLMAESTDIPLEVLGTEMTPLCAHYQNESWEGAFPSALQCGC